jgi:hypothetical protein
MPNEIALLAQRRGIAYEYERSPRLETYLGGSSYPWDPAREWTGFGPSVFA